MSSLQERTRPRLREVLAFLASRGGTSTKAEVLENIEKLLPPKGLEDLELVSNGSPRWQNALLWQTTGFVKAGWITKDGAGTWTITDLGRAALEKYTDAAQLAAEADRLYYEWLDARNAHRKQGWLLRNPEEVGSWLREGFIAVIAPNLRTLSAAGTSEDLAAIVHEDMAYLGSQELDLALTAIDGFVKKMHVGDVVVTTSEDQVFVGDVTGDLQQTGNPNVELRRTVDWRNIDSPISFEQIPGQLKAKLTSNADWVNLTKDLKLIDELTEPREGGELQKVHAGATGRVLLHEVSQRLADDLLIPKKWLSELRDLLAERRQLVLYGPPGTGKTYLATRLAEDLVGAEQVKLVQFHPSYTYEDFFEGYRPQAGAGGTIGFRLQPGPLRRLVTRAVEHKDQAFVLIIDEINRANLAKVFGELYFLLEYRDDAVELLYSTGTDPFTLPNNVFMIGTMNTADRSIALVDAAMRRRFAFVALDPSAEPTRGLLSRWSTAHNLPAVGSELFVELNRRIDDPEFQIGPSYFMRSRDSDAFSLERLQRIWQVDILPLLEEHYFGLWQDKQKLFRFEAVLAGTSSDESSAESHDRDEGTGD